MFIRILSAIVLLFIMTDYSALAQANSDSLSVIVHYPCGSSNLSKISSNKLSLQQFVHQIDSLCQLPSVTPVSLLVTSATSPEGSLKINKALARKRNKALMDYLQQHSETFSKIYNSLDIKLNEYTTNHKFRKIRRTAYPSLRYSKVTLFMNIEKDTIAVVEQPSQDDVQTEDSAELEPEMVTEKDTAVVLLETNDKVIANYLRCTEFG